MLANCSILWIGRLLGYISHVDGDVSSKKLDNPGCDCYCLAQFVFSE